MSGDPLAMSVYERSPEQRHVKLLVYLLLVDLLCITSAAKAKDYWVNLVKGSDITGSVRKLSSSELLHSIFNFSGMNGGRTVRVFHNCYPRRR